MRTTPRKATHTKTPWETHGFEICHEVSKNLVTAVPIYTGRIEGTLSPVSDDWDEAQANAALIVHRVNHTEAVLKAGDALLEKIGMIPGIEKERKAFIEALNGLGS